MLILIDVHEPSLLNLEHPYWDFIQNVFVQLDSIHYKVSECILSCGKVYVLVPAGGHVSPRYPQRHL